MPRCQPADVCELVVLVLWLGLVLLLGLGLETLGGLPLVPTVRIALLAPYILIIHMLIPNQGKIFDHVCTTLTSKSMHMQTLKRVKIFQNNYARVSSPPFFLF